MLFISSCSLNAVAKISSTMLNKSSENGPPSFLPDLKGNACSFRLLSMMLAVGLYYMAFITLRHVPSIQALLRVLIINGFWILSTAIFCICLYGQVVFILRFVYVMYHHVYWFVAIVPTLHLWNKSHLIILYEFFNVLQDPLCYFVCILVSMFIIDVGT